MSIIGKIYYNSIEEETLKLGRKGPRIKFKIVIEDFTGTFAYQGAGHHIAFTYWGTEEVYWYTTSCQGDGRVSFSKTGPLSEGYSVSSTTSGGGSGVYGFSCKISTDPNDSYPAANCFGVRTASIVVKPEAGAVMGVPGSDRPPGPDALPEVHLQTTYWVTSDPANWPLL